jgi:sugar lactone lactonase YvrE
LEYKPPFSTGQNASIVLGAADFTHATSGSTQNEMSLMQEGSVRSDKQGNIWVADFNNNRVLEFALGPGFSNGQNAALVLGQPDFTSRSGATSMNGLSLPWGMTFDKKGNLYVADFENCRVLEFKAKKGKFQSNQNAALVLGQSSFTTSNCAVNQTSLYRPSAVVIGP